uniref:Dendritic cell-specific transmembrane protein-like domain-containing protein n=1 Tax=Cuerna arida TaxID=1464854 RepID=A0A1B6FDP0_9HEMI
MLMAIICSILQLLHGFLVPVLKLKRDEYGGAENTLKLLGYAIDKLDDMRESRPFIHGLIFTDDQYRFCKAFIGFIFGTCVGIAFYEFILSGLSVSVTTVYFLGKISTVLMAIGCMVFTQIRCLVLICIPTFFGSAGRHIFQALILTALISGPVNNVIQNIEESQRMISCSNRMAYNLSQARYGLLVKPFKMAFLSTKIETEELRDTLSSVKNVVEPIAQEIEGKDDVKFIKEENDYVDEETDDTKRSEEIENKYKHERVKRMPVIPYVVKPNETERLISKGDEYQKNYYKKLELRCENVKTSMTKACQNTFHKLYDQCMATLHWSFNWAVCWAVKLDFICDLVRMFSYGSYDCDPSTVVSGSVGKQYWSILRTGPKLKAKVAEEKTQYKIHNPPNFVSLHSIITLTKEFHHNMVYAHDIVKLSIKLMRSILAFLFIWVIINAQTYHDKFVQEPGHDNNYLTAQLRMLDAQRHIEGKKTVFPLMKLERAEMVDPYSPFLGQVELGEEWGKNFYAMLFLILFSLLAILMDAVLAIGLTWMSKNLEFSYKESGEHSFKMEVLGVGFIASIVRSIIKPFDFSKTLKQEVSNRHCLPNPSYLPTSAYAKVFALLFCLYCMEYCVGYIRRLRRAICAFYYREQEKKRIEFLYKRILDDRKQLIDRNIKELAEKASDAGLMFELRELFILSQRFPSCTLLRWLSLSRAACCMCNEIEVRKPQPIEKYLYCEKCKIFFCPECWQNFSQTCVVCNAMARKDELLKQGKQGISAVGQAGLPRGVNYPSIMGIALPQVGNPPSTSGSGLPQGGNPSSTSGRYQLQGGNLPSTSGSGLPK